MALEYCHHHVGGGGFCYHNVLNCKCYLFDFCGCYISVAGDFIIKCRHDLFDGFHICFTVNSPNNVICPSMQAYL